MGSEDKRLQGLERLTFDVARHGAEASLAVEQDASGASLAAIGALEGAVAVKASRSARGVKLAFMASGVASLPTISVGPASEPQSAAALITPVSPRKRNL